VKPSLAPARPTLLVALAHPDDEAFGSGGTLAHYASLGVRVLLACATRGESGKVTDPALGTVADLGALREQELHDACAALGIEKPIFLDYHDSGRLDRVQDHNPQALFNANLLEVEAKIVALIEEYQPDVMLGFDPHGIYGHADHLVMHRAAMGAFFQAGRLEKPPQRLFATVIPTQKIRAMQANRPNSPLGQLDPSIYGVAINTIAVTMEVSAQQERKMATMRAHRSQVGPNSSFAALSPEVLAQILGAETFGLQAIRGPVQQWPLRGFFDGMNLGVI
jgi:N-acetyl-1-D-myo-inositol-2-amino-2-deoxy-alpha-D-glucopyranoside deacetylase